MTQYITVEKKVNKISIPLKTFDLLQDVYKKMAPFKTIINKKENWQVLIVGELAKKKSSKQKKKKSTFHILVSYDGTFYVQRKTAFFSKRNHRHVFFWFLALKQILFI